MLNHCFNPKCKKPLHYLRDGKVFVFGVQDSDADGDVEGSRLEHYWLCGTCAEHFGMAHDADGAHMIKKKVHLRPVKLPEPPQALAS